MCVFIWICVFVWHVCIYSMCLCARRALFLLSQCVCVSCILMEFMQAQFCKLYSRVDETVIRIGEFLNNSFYSFRCGRWLTNRLITVGTSVKNNKHEKTRTQPQSYINAKGCTWKKTYRHTHIYNRRHHHNRHHHQMQNDECMMSNLWVLNTTLRESEHILTRHIYV